MFYEKNKKFHCKNIKKKTDCRFTHNTLKFKKVCKNNR